MNRVAGQMNPVFMMGHKLLVEKYDADKDGKLSEQEEATLKADAKKAAESRKAEMDARREAAKKAQDDNKADAPKA
jgi:hypothetical protein